MKDCFECDELADHDHHVVPESRGGKRTVPLCGSCHAKAHHRDGNMAHARLIREGQAAAREAGKTWGGRKAGTVTKAVSEKADAIRTLHAAGKSVSDIARSTGVSRPTVYAVVRGGW